MENWRMWKITVIILVGINMLAAMLLGAYTVEGFRKIKLESQPTAQELEKLNQHQQWLSGKLLELEESLKPVETGRYHDANTEIDEKVLQLLLNKTVVIKAKGRLEEQEMETKGVGIGLGSGKYVLVLGGMDFYRGMPPFLAGALPPPKEVKYYYGDYLLDVIAENNRKFLEKGIFLLKLPDGVRVVSYKIGDSSKLGETDALFIPTALIEFGDELPPPILFKVGVAAAKTPSAATENSFIFFPDIWQGLAGAPILATTSKKVESLDQLELVGIVGNIALGLNINEILDLVLQETGINLK